MKWNSVYNIKTSNGFKSFEGIKKSKNNKSILVEFEDGTKIETTRSHYLYDIIKNKKIKVKKLSVNDIINGKRIINIISNSYINTKDFYDVIEVEDGHHFSVNDMESSNCAFIRPKLWDEFTDSVFPAQDALAEKQTILSSTPNGLNHWYNIVEGARKETNGYFIADCDWKEVPRWNRDGSLKDPQTFKDEQIAKNGDMYFAQNFSCSFLGSSSTLISSDALKSIKPMQHDDILRNTLFEGLKIFEEPKAGHNYIVTCDPNKQGIDAVGIQVTDVTSLPFVQVATAQLKDSFLVIPGKLFDLGNYYNTAMIISENNIGESIPSTVFYNYDYEGEVFIENDKNGRPKKEFGFRTTTKTKKLALSLLKKFIEEGKLIINDETTLNELFNFIANAKGSYSAEEGYHDDLVMSLMLTFAPFLDFKNWDDFKGFVEYLEKKEEQKEKDDDDFIKFLDFGFTTTAKEEDLPFSDYIDNKW